MALTDPGSLWKVAQLLVVAGVAVYTFRKEMLNGTGATVAFLMGAVIVLATDLFWLLLLFSLLGLASAATKFRFKEKESKKVAEKGGGKRRSRNVIANGITPTVIAALVPLMALRWESDTVAAVVYASAIAAAAADTIASEFGSLSRNVYLITTFKRVPAGTDGGVSLPGQVAALGGATAISLLAMLFLGLLSPDHRMAVTPATFLIPVVSGFFGCQVDSIVGATLETRGLVTKEEVNAIGITAGAGLGFVLVLLTL